MRQRLKPRWLPVAAGVLLAATALLLWFASRPGTPSLLADDGQRLAELRARWARGEVVALVRHVERCDRSDNPCLDGEDGITVLGSEVAGRLGADFARLLPLDHATVFHSPVKRTAQTAAFMFGGSSEARDWLRAGCKQNLYEDILLNKEEGSNLVLVTHSTCIEPLGEAQGNRLIDLDVDGPEAYGVVLFLVADTQAWQLRVLGYLYADDWRALAGG